MQRKHVPVRSDEACHSPAYPCAPGEHADMAQDDDLVGGPSPRLRLRLRNRRWSGDLEGGIAHAYRCDPGQQFGPSPTPSERSAASTPSRSSDESPCGTCERPLKSPFREWAVSIASNAPARARCPAPRLRRSPSVECEGYERAVNSEAMHEAQIADENFKRVQHVIAQFWQASLGFWALWRCFVQLRCTDSESPAIPMSSSAASVCRFSKMLGAVLNWIRRLRHERSLE